MDEAVVTIERIIDYFKKNQNQKITAGQLAEWFYNNFPDEAQAKSEIWDGSMKGLISQISGEISSRISTIQSRKELNIKTEDIPKNNTNREEYGNSRQLYIYYGEEENERDVEASSFVNLNDDKIYSEEELYPFLHKYLESIDVHSKRINDKKKNKPIGNKGKKLEEHVSGDWRYPDIVGMQDLRIGWEDEIKECASVHANKKIQFWSFEVKKEISRSNVRKAFFQAVSNSSWANFGYLVALQVQCVETYKELQILSALHGIGYIKLDLESPADSQIIIPARERDNIDWDNANRLAKVSKDFRDYLNAIARYKDRVHVQDWDNNVE